MNLGLKKELITKCNDKIVLKDYFNDIEFLESINSKDINEILEEEKQRFNSILDFIEETMLTITYMFLDDYYLTKRYKVIRFFLIRISEDFYNINKEYYDMVKGYSKRLDELEYAIDSLDRFEISDVKLLYELVFLTFITSINDLAVFDYNMLNKNKYKDTDLEDLSVIKDSTKAYELSLRTLNRNLKKEN